MSRGILSWGFCPGGFCPGGFCPDTVSEADTLDAFCKVALFQTDYDSKCLQGLVAESWNFGELNNGTTKSVFGQAWLDTCLSSLRSAESSSVTCRDSNNIYWFRDGQKVQATKSTTIFILQSILFVSIVACLRIHKEHVQPLPRKPTKPCLH